MLLKVQEKLACEPCDDFDPKNLSDVRQLNKNEAPGRLKILALLCGDLWTGSD